jgi:hypothetical protein
MDGWETIETLVDQVYVTPHLSTLQVMFSCSCN